jgi:hypothetical protein
MKEEDDEFARWFSVIFIVIIMGMLLLGILKESKAQTTRGIEIKVDSCYCECDTLII